MELAKKELEQILDFGKWDKTDEKSDENDEPVP